MFERTSSQGTAIHVLDGGLGTTLEDVFGRDVSSPLWSAKPIDEEPDVIIEAHLAFLRAGADVLLTSTYQCSFSTFDRAGYAPADALRIMRKAVHLAHEARSRYLDEDPTQVNRNIKVILALGPFGATLTPTQEFDGFYPPPYGPQAYNPSLPKSELVNSFGRPEDEAEAVEALAQFHVERLRIFTANQDTWNLIDGIAFETIPLRREVLAIRRAVEALRQESQNSAFKPWWISTLYPEGSFPEKRPDGIHVSSAEIVEAILDGTPPRPDGIGVNCTGTIHLRSIIQALTENVKARSDLTEIPSLVLYPNGGDEWDPNTKTWQQCATGDEKAEAWASQVDELVKSMQQDGYWREILVGGCCRAGPTEIAALVRRVKGS